jgi:hypothetical protein
MSWDLPAVYGLTQFLDPDTDEVVYEIPNPAVIPVGRFHGLWVSRLVGENTPTSGGTAVNPKASREVKVSIPVDVSDDVFSDGTAPTHIGEGVAENVAEIEDVLVAASTVAPYYLNARHYRYEGDAAPSVGRVQVVGLTPAADADTFTLDVSLIDGPLSTPGS